MKYLSLVNEKKMLEDWVEIVTEKFIAHIALTICWVHCVNSGFPLLDVACIVQ